MIESLPLLAVGDFYGDSHYWDEVVLLGSDQIALNAANSTDVYGLTYAALANHSYEVEAHLVVSSSSAAGLILSVAYSAAGAVGATILHAMGANKTAGVDDGENLGSTNATYCTIGGSTKGLIWLKALVVTGANAGNIKIQHNKITSGTSTVYGGSVMKIKLLA